MFSAKNFLPSETNPYAAAVFMYGEYTSPSDTSSNEIYLSFIISHSIIFTVSHTNFPLVTPAPSSPSKIPSSKKLLKNSDFSR